MNYLLSGLSCVWTLQAQIRNFSKHESRGSLGPKSQECQQYNLTMVKFVHLSSLTGCPETKPERNRKPEPLEPFSQKLKKVLLEPSELFFQEPKLEPELSLSVETMMKRTIPFQRGSVGIENPGTTWTVPSTNRNCTEPNRGHPELIQWWFLDFAELLGFPAIAAFIVSSRFVEHPATARKTKQKPEVLTILLKVDKEESRGWPQVAYGPFTSLHLHV